MFSPPPADLAAALEAARSRVGIFTRLRYCADVGSTNDAALSLAAAGEPEGTFVLADAQRAGRGRRGHEWFSPPGAGIYLSLIVRPHGPPQVLPILTLASGVALARAVRSVSGLPVELKWPNDVVVGRPWRKLGGVLCELSASGAGIEAIVVGMGLNVRDRAWPEALAGRASSIEGELGRSVEAVPLIVELLARMHDGLGSLRAERVDEITDAWRELGGAGLQGAPVRWSEGARPRRGRAIDIDADGALLVDIGGRTERLVAGEVTWEGMSRE